MATSIRSMTIDEFVRLYNEEGPFEIVNGEISKLSPTVAGHGKISKRLQKPLLDFEETSHAGQFFFETPFVVTDDSDWVRGSRVPDMLFIQADRWAEYVERTPDWESRPLMLIPDLVVEIVSPTDKYSDLQEKVEGYLTDGVRAVWVVDARRRTLTIYTAGSYRTLTDGDRLAGEELLPGFTLDLAAVFA